MQPKNIQEVIDALSEIIETAKSEQAPYGYFASLYRKMTIAVQQGIINNAFEDGTRMEALDVVFAQRYLDAFAQMRAGQMPSKAWSVAFDAAKQNKITVLQHLLLGINAHINLDLGIAAAQVCPNKAIFSLKNDFDKINSVITTIADEVQSELAEIWFPLRFISAIAGKNEDAVINFSIKLARDAAWKVATDVAELPTYAQSSYIANLDGGVTFVAQKVINPNLKENLICKAIKCWEIKNPTEIIKILA